MITTAYFYSRPCGRGDGYWRNRDNGIRKISTHAPAGGATQQKQSSKSLKRISTHAPAGGATIIGEDLERSNGAFLLTPLREGRPSPLPGRRAKSLYFYSRPCGRGDLNVVCHVTAPLAFLLTPLREGRLF